MRASRELPVALRSAIGVDELVRLLITESLLLSAHRGAAALALAWIRSALRSHDQSATTPARLRDSAWRDGPFRGDLPRLYCASRSTVVALRSGRLFGLVPAICVARASLTDASRIAVQTGLDPAEESGAVYVGCSWANGSRALHCAARGLPASCSAPSHLRRGFLVRSAQRAHAERACPWKSSAIRAWLLLAADSNAFARGPAWRMRDHNAAAVGGCNSTRSYFRSAKGYMGQFAGVGVHWTSPHVVLDTSRATRRCASSQRGSPAPAVVVVNDGAAARILAWRISDWEHIELARRHGLRGSRLHRRHVRQPQTSAATPDFLLVPSVSRPRVDRFVRTSAIP